MCDYTRVINFCIIIIIIIIIIAAANRSKHHASLSKSVYAACLVLLPGVVEAGVEP